MKNSWIFLALVIALMAFACGKRQEKYLSPLQEFVAAKGIDTTNAMEKSTPIGIAWALEQRGKKPSDFQVFLVTPNGDTLYGKFIGAVVKGTEMTVLIEVPLAGLLELLVDLKDSQENMTTYVVYFFHRSALADPKVWAKTYMFLTDPGSEEDAPFQQKLMGRWPADENMVPVHEDEPVGTFFVLLR